MPRVQRWLVGSIAAGLLLIGGGPGAAGAAETGGSGEVTGRVTTQSGAPLSDITVAAVTVGGDAIVSTKSRPDGTYVLTLDPGTYDVGFNAEVVAKINVAYQTVIFGGPGPGPADDCTVCGGQAVTVTAGAVTANVNGVLPRSPFTETKLRPLSGNTIGLLNGRITFKVGCHDPAGCHGTANLRLGSSTSVPVIATAKLSIGTGDVGVLHFTIPVSVRRRLQRAGTRGLEANVALATPQAHSVTRFKLRA